MCYKDAFTLLFRIVVIYLFIIFSFLFLKECIKLIKSIILIQKNIYFECRYSSNNPEKSQFPQ